MTSLYFLLLLLPLITLAQTTTVLEMVLKNKGTDGRGSSAYLGGDDEYHCLYTSAGATSPDFVRGTYGFYGYFEGPISASRTAAIKWIETPSSLVPRGGSATLQYTADFKEVSGTVGTTSSGGGWTTWASGGGQVAVGGVPEVDCMATPPSFRAALPALTAFYNSVQGRVAMCNDPAGFRGSYTFTYSSKECREQSYDCSLTSDGRGHYGKAGIVTSTTGGYVVSTTFAEDAGPATGSQGSNMYTVAAFSDTTLQPIQLRGFYCNVERGKRTSCYPEAYDIKSGSTPTLTDCTANYDLALQSASTPPKKSSTAKQHPSQYLLLPVVIALLLNIF